MQLGPQAGENPGLADRILVLRVAAFFVPVIAVVVSSILWHGAKLTEGNKKRLAEVLLASLRESRFNEVERILRKNARFLPDLPAEALGVLFRRQMVRELLRGGSALHLSLLSDKEFLKSLKDRHTPVDAVVRELLLAENSPLRSAVVASFRGHEGLPYTQEEQDVFGSTFQNPEWYCEANGHYPLIRSAMEELRSGRLDVEYNQRGSNYETNEGISPRSRCVIFLAIKTEVLAIAAAVSNDFEEDIYVTDLWNLFRAIRKRSVYDSEVWEGALSNREHPTPYAYLLYQIVDDLQQLSYAAFRRASSSGRESSIAPPGNMASRLSPAWAYCLLEVASDGAAANLSESFRRHVLRAYLEFVVQLGSEFGLWGREGVTGLDPWRNLFCKTLGDCFRGQDRNVRSWLTEGINALDGRSPHISAQKVWLKRTLGIPQ